MILDRFIELLKNRESLKDAVSYQVPLAPLSSMKVGGVGGVLIAPKDESSLIEALDLIKESGLRATLLGGATNVVIADEGLDITLTTRALKGVRVTRTGESVLLFALAGSPISLITRVCIDECISGFETFSGLPGTIGGAAAMNARCFGVEISDIFSSGDFIEGAPIRTLPPLVFSRDKKDNECGLEKTLDKTSWGYKKSPFSNGSGRLLKSVTLRLKPLERTPSNKKMIIDQVRHYIKARADKGHFRFPSCGSVFKNDRRFGEPSGAIIDKCGLKGLSVGGSQVAPFHGNIIINTGGATAKDVRDLATTVWKVVKEKTGFSLDAEILFSGV